ncbi:MAG: TonB-dependent receptor plug domain-containing protein, partial [Gammaproteobacteria bacterium]
MKILSFILSIGLVVGLVGNFPQAALGQNVLEEIIVTARKREENLMEVPVSVSVLSSDLLMDSSVIDQFDLYELTPGISYDQSQDRQGARASVRGVWTRAQNPVRAKVTSFIDGVPVLGQTGSLQFSGIDRIEVMRGPQSAAFGRATFSGAINYVTSNPGEELESQILLSAPDLGRDIA